MSSISDAVRGTKNPQEALLVIAEALDQVLARLEELAEQPKADDGWGKWSMDDEVQAAFEKPDEPAFDIVIGEGVTEISFKAPSEEKLARRRLFAEAVLQLQEQGLEQYGIDDPFDTYAKGGPLWLYHGNRELFMQYSPEVRAAMVMDVEEDDKREAHEMSRDVLKDEEGLSKAFVMEAINGSVPD